MAKEKKDLAGLTVEQLQTDLAQLRAEYSDNKFDHAVRGMANPMDLRDQRREVARYLTEMRGREVLLMTPDQLALRSKIRSRRRRGA
jgi:large subunit ribosomal protein L29